MYKITLVLAVTAALIAFPIALSAQERIIIRTSDGSEVYLDDSGESPAAPANDDSVTIKEADGETLVFRDESGESFYVIKGDNNTVVLYGDNGTVIVIGDDNEVVSVEDEDAVEDPLPVIVETSEETNQNESGDFPGLVELPPWYVAPVSWAPVFKFWPGGWLCAPSWAYSRPVSIFWWTWPTVYVSPLYRPYWFFNNWYGSYYYCGLYNPYYSPSYDYYGYPYWTYSFRWSNMPSWRWVYEPSRYSFYHHRDRREPFVHRVVHGAGETYSYLSHDKDTWSRKGPDGRIHRPPIGTDGVRVRRDSERPERERRVIERYRDFARSAAERDANRREPVRITSAERDNTTRRDFTERPAIRVTERTFENERISRPETSRVFDSPRPERAVSERPETTLTFVNRDGRRASENRVEIESPVESEKPRTSRREFAPRETTPVQPSRISEAERNAPRQRTSSRIAEEPVERTVVKEQPAEMRRISERQPAVERPAPTRRIDEPVRVERKSEPRPAARVNVDDIKFRGEPAKEERKPTARSSRSESKSDESPSRMSSRSTGRTASPSGSSSSRSSSSRQSPSSSSPRRR
jgi:hypothetical protein